MKNPFLDDDQPVARNPFLDDAPAVNRVRTMDVAPDGAMTPTLPPAPTSGLTIAPKGGIAREAPREFDYAAASAGDLATRAGENLVPSATRFGTDLLNVAMHPVETVQTLGKVAAGGVQKLIPGEQSYEPYADAIGQFYADRYGGVENAKRTFAEDPIGFAADLATVFGGGQLALARAPGVAGQVGRAAGSVSRAIDPINATIQAGKAVGKGVGHVGATALGVTTGTGGATVRQAARTGFEGGEAGAAFRDNMRGNVPMEEVVSDAKRALGAVRAERSAAYKAGMSGVEADTKVLDLSKIDDALNKTKADHTFKGVSVSPSSDKVIQQIAGVLDEWRGLDPAEFHTAAGFDALKRRIGDIRESAPHGTPERRVADQVYTVVKDQITKQAPAYAKTMKGYEEASTLIREIEKTLSLNPKASVDTALRKLQSVMRNNVNTNWGKRADLVKLLEQYGAGNILAKLAGQSAASWAPRGLMRTVAGLQTVGSLGAAVPTAGAALAGLATLPMQSPRIVNELVHAGGRVANALNRVPARNALQAGYATRDQSVRR